MSIIVNNITYIHPDKEVLFQNISFSVPTCKKVNLIGDNGSGKSTILKLLAGQIRPSTGEIILADTPYYVPQHFGQFNDLPVAAALGIDKKIDALKAILNGDASVENFTLLNDDWEIEDRVKGAFSKWNLPHIRLSQSMSELSGGEKTKVFLAGITIHSPSIVLLDEPSNHLDKQARKQLYEFVKTTKSTLVLVSHDRTILNLIDLTYELTGNIVEVYGGNYEFYKQQKQDKLNALYTRLVDKEKELNQARRMAQQTAEKKQKKDGQGKKSMKDKGIPRIIMGKIKEGAEFTAAKLKEVHTGKISSINDDLINIRQEIAEKDELKITFQNTTLHAGKILVTAKEINFGYTSGMLWEDPLSFQIKSGERVAITGNNGSGKTTLLKIILGQLEPETGEIYRADFSYLYIDQEYSIINNSFTVFEQIQSFNSRHLLEHELKTLLHHFLFPYDTWDKTCDKFSGGEKMKLVFCCLIANNNIPDMFILDEPTNNLDINSLNIITSALKDYKGTILIISHDQYFMDEIKVERAIEL